MKAACRSPLGHRLLEVYDTVFDLGTKVKALLVSQRVQVWNVEPDGPKFKSPLQSHGMVPRPVKEAIKGIWQGSGGSVSEQTGVPL